MPAKLERCVNKVSKKSLEVNPWAVCKKISEFMVVYNKHICLRCKSKGGLKC